MESKITEVVKFVTSDGTEYCSKNDAIQHECGKQLQDWLWNSGTVEHYFESRVNIHPLIRFIIDNFEELETIIKSDI